MVNRKPITTLNDIITFTDLCEKHSTWIIKYCSGKFAFPLFLVWYTDENSTDRLLTYEDGKIFAVKSLPDVNRTLLSEINNLVVFDNLHPWLDSSKNIEAVEYCTYDVTSVTNNISNNNLDIATVEDFVNFINLFVDFINQDEKNNHLQVFADNKLIKETWDYFYNYIFWTRFNDKEKSKAWDRTKLEIDTNELLIKFKDIINIFNDNIRQTEKVIC